MDKFIPFLLATCSDTSVSIPFQLMILSLPLLALKKKPGAMYSPVTQRAVARKSKRSRSLARRGESQVYDTGVGLNNALFALAPHLVFHAAPIAHLHFDFFAILRGRGMERSRSGKGS